MDSSSKLYQIFSVDGVSSILAQRVSSGILGTMSWSPDLDNEITKEICFGLPKHGGYPSFYAAQAYDTILAVDHAIATSGSKDTDKMRAALAKGNIPTTRGC
ncbi:MAG: hypothetical protein CM15mP95_2030 [Alphaproteobacteria bacterium]|nr:MAG: hypothetical protein CM15mP95_2030 [Alphaproteobacteria bacterium]